MRGKGYPAGRGLGAPRTCYKSRPFYADSALLA